ncbi:hypothetical protein [uncultured Cytophaga sp.]|uniref:hypothetical protein n=1 Tax=uncultured Cytophaga sp. TaxID=160238 RepID=UPI002639C818|nr:hypothetical protein [uncultured Cytophaga sp.]
MDKEKLQQKLEKFKAAAMGFIGAGILTQGALYFQPKASYHVPRILYPVFEIAGNVGLAIGMLMLGLFLLYLGLNKWKNHGGASNHYLIIGAVGIVLFSGILWFSNKPKDKRSAAEIQESFETDRQQQIDKIKGMEKPDFNNVEVENYILDFNALQKKHLEYVKSNDTIALEKNRAEYDAWRVRSTDIFSKLETGEEKYHLSLYMAKLAFEWQDVELDNTIE